MWLIVNCKNGVSSHEIHRSIKVTQTTAWFMQHRIRLALSAGSFDKLSGEVEADETFIGGKARNMHVSKRERRITGHRRQRQNRRNGYPKTWRRSKGFCDTEPKEAINPLRSPKACKGRFRTLH